MREAYKAVHGEGTEETGAIHPRRGVTYPATSPAAARAVARAKRASVMIEHWNGSWWEDTGYYVYPAK